MSWLPVELGQAALIPAEAAINHALRFDPGSQVLLAKAAGKLVHIRLAGTATVAIRLLDDSIVLSLSTDELSEDGPYPDVALIGTSSDFLALARANNKASAMLSGGILVDGDTELAILLGKLVDQMNIDWEAMITPVTGGMLAHQLGQGLRGLMGWGKRTGSTFKTAARDYLYDEARILVHPAELEASAERIDNLRLASDRLEARIQQLEARKAAEQQPPAQDAATDKED